MVHGIFLPENSGIFHPKYISIGKDFQIGANSQLYCQDPEAGSELVLGNRVGLSQNEMIIADCGGKIHIGNNVLIGPATVLRAANHKFQDSSRPIRDQGHVSGSIVIEDDVWLAAGVTVLPNVKIGKGSVIGAGSVVCKDIPPYSIAVGSPAKVIGQRS